jgi:hypothetical protein
MVSNQIHVCVNDSRQIQSSNYTTENKVHTLKFQTLTHKLEVTFIPFDSLAVDMKSDVFAWIEVTERL